MQEKQRVFWINIPRGARVLHRTLAARYGGERCSQCSIRWGRVYAQSFTVFCRRCSTCSIAESQSPWSMIKHAGWTSYAQYILQGSADRSYIPFRGFTFCILCPSARVGCLQYKVSKTFLAEDQHPRMYVQYIWYFAKPGDDNVRMGVSGDGPALVTPHAGSVKCDSLTHFRNCNQFFSLKILHPFSICIFWFKLIL